MFVRNAVQYTAEGTEVEIELAPIRASLARIMGVGKALDGSAKAKLGVGSMRCHYRSRPRGRSSGECSRRIFRLFTGDDARDREAGALDLVWQLPTAPVRCMAEALRPPMNPPAASL